MLTVQLWDNDLLPGGDDYLGEVKIPLDRKHPLSATNDGRVRPLGLFTRLRDRRAKKGKEHVRGERVSRKVWYPCYVGKREDAPREVAPKPRSRKCGRVLCDCFWACFCGCLRCLWSHDDAEAEVLRPRKGAEGGEGGEAVRAVRPPKVSDDDKSYRGEVQLSFHLVKAEVAGSEDGAVGAGRKDPNRDPILQDPRRPDDSFLWWKHPLKSLQFLVCDNLRVWVCSVILVVVFFLLIGYSCSSWSRSGWRRSRKALSSDAYPCGIRRADHVRARGIDLPSAPAPPLPRSVRIVIARRPAPSPSIARYTDIQIHRLCARRRARPEGDIKGLRSARGAAPVPSPSCEI